MRRKRRPGKSLSAVRISPPRLSPRLAEDPRLVKKVSSEGGSPLLRFFFLRRLRVACSSTKKIVFPHLSAFRSCFPHGDISRLLAGGNYQMRPNG